MNASHIAVTFAALGDKTRLSMVEDIAARPRSVTEIAAGASLTLAGAMKHLRQLEGAGLVRRKKAGRTVTYSLAPGAFTPILKWADRQTRFWEQSLRRLAKVIADDSRND